MKLFYNFISEIMFEFKLLNWIYNFIAFNQVPMNFICLNSNWKFDLNKSIGKKKKALFLWAETSQPNLETGLLTPFTPPMVHWPILATTGDEVGPGVAREEAWTEGDRWEVVTRTEAHWSGLSMAR
jgi:hypothetical protein